MGLRGPSDENHREGLAIEAMPVVAQKSAAASEKSPCGILAVVKDRGS